MQFIYCVVTVLEEDIKNQVHRITELQDRIVEKNQQVQNLLVIYAPYIILFLLGYL